MKQLLTVDFPADAAYLTLEDAPVAETVEAAPGILIDLDERGVTVGIELLDLSVEIPSAELEHRYRIRPEHLQQLRSVRSDATTLSMGT